MAMAYRGVAIMLAVVAGVAVACAGIALYQRFKGRKDGKPSPRIIEISSLTHGHRSPNYSRYVQLNSSTLGVA